MGVTSETFQGLQICLPEMFIPGNPQACRAATLNNGPQESEDPVRIAERSENIIWRPERFKVRPVKCRYYGGAFVISVWRPEGKYMSGPPELTLGWKFVEDGVTVKKLWLDSH